MIEIAIFSLSLISSVFLIVGTARVSANVTIVKNLNYSICRMTFE